MQTRLFCPIQNLGVYKMDSTKFCKDCHHGDISWCGSFCQRSPETVYIDFVTGHEYPSLNHLLCLDERGKHGLTDRLFRFFEKENGRAFCGPEGRFFVRKNKETVS